MIAGVVALAVFGVVVLGVAVVERSIERARAREAAWQALAARLRPGMAMAAGSMVAFGVSFAAAARAAADFGEQLRRTDEVMSMSGDDIRAFAERGTST